MRRIGSALTLAIARELGRPVIHLHAGDSTRQLGRRLAQFVTQHVPVVSDTKGIENETLVIRSASSVAIWFHTRTSSLLALSPRPAPSYVMI